MNDFPNSFIFIIVLTPLCIKIFSCWISLVCHLLLEEEPIMQSKAGTKLHGPFWR